MIERVWQWIGRLNYTNKGKLLKQVEIEGMKT